MTRYDPEWTSAHYDGIGDDEWARLESSTPDRVSLHQHRRLVREHVQELRRLAQQSAISQSELRKAQVELLAAERTVESDSDR